MDRLDYGKIVNNELIYPPIEYNNNGCIVIWYDEEFLISKGWKKIKWEDISDETKEYTRSYKETETNITVSWEEINN